MTQQDIKTIFRQKLANNEFKFDKKTNQKFIEIVDAHFMATSSYIVYHNHITPPTMQWYEDNYMPLVDNQIDEIVDIIKKDPDTRQAYIVMIDPKKYRSGDKICTIGMQVIYQKDKKKIDYIVYMRSNNACEYTQDYNWQFGIWCEIANKLSAAINEEINLGNMYWNAGSLHIYEEDFIFLSDDTRIAKALKGLEQLAHKKIMEMIEYDRKRIKNHDA